MTEKINAAQEIERAARGWQNLMAVAAELRNVGSLEASAAETKKHIAVLAEQQALAEAKLAQAENSLAGIAETVSGARAQADQIVADAQASARAILDKCDEECTSKRKALNTELASLESRLGGLKFDLASLQADIAASTARKVEIEGEVEALRKRFGG